MNYETETEIRYKDVILQGRWEMFEFLSTRWYGSQQYFLKENGLIYSDISHRFITLDEAVHEFIGLTMEG